MASPAVVLEPELAIHTRRPGPIVAADFEGWSQDPDNPFELVCGWVVPMSPGTLRAGGLLAELCAALLPHCRPRGWQVVADARHRLPTPADTVVFPDLAVHCAETIETLPATDTAARVPDLVIEILGAETADRDRGPRGAKYLAYEASGVREYYVTWPDGRDAAAWRRVDGGFVSVTPDAEGFFESLVLGAGLRPVSPALRPR